MVHIPPYPTKYGALALNPKPLSFGNRQGLASKGTLTGLEFRVQGLGFRVQGLGFRQARSTVGKISRDFEPQPSALSFEG